MGQTLSFIRALSSRSCNVRELINDVTFLPPCPCQLDLIGNIAGKYTGKVFVGEKTVSIPDNVKVLFLPIRNDVSICIFHIQTSSKRAAIIYSHGNAADCGSMLPRCIQMSEKLNVDIILYDYEGYGYSSGEYSSSSICKDVEEVYKYVTSSFDSTHIFLYGESIGSIPTLHLAAKIHALYKKGMSSSKEQTNGIEKDPTQIIPEPELSQTDCESEFSDCSLEIDEELDSLSQANYPHQKISLQAIKLSLSKAKKPPKPPVDTNEIGGVILHSALLSGGRTLFSNDFFRFCDPFDNTKSASRVGCPVFHIHGTKDTIVPFSSGIKLYEYTRSSYEPWWVFNAHHNDIITTHEREYYQRVSMFLTFCLGQFS